MKIKIAKVWSKILKKEDLMVVAEKNGRQFFGALFFKPVGESIKEVLEEVEIPDESTNIEVAKACYPLYEKYGLLAEDGSSFKCCAHWAYMNGLADTYEVKKTTGVKSSLNNSDYK